MVDLPFITLETAKRGDTWGGIGFVELIQDEVPMDLTGASVLMQMRRKPSHGLVVAEWTTEDDSIVIQDAANGILRVMPKLMDVPAKCYHWDLEVTFANGRVLTVLTGIWEIEGDSSRKN